MEVDWVRVWQKDAPKSQPVISAINDQEMFEKDRE
jgi:hypothetical protein